MSSVISVRVRSDLKREAERLGINLRSVLEKALAEEFEKRRREEFDKAVHDVVKHMAEVDIDEFTKAVKESRKER